MRSTAAALLITIEPLEEASLIRAAGEIDLSTVAALGHELESARETNATALLDLSEVTFIDSTGLHLLLEASRHAKLSDWPFFIVRPSAAVQGLVETSRTADQLALVEPLPEHILGSR
jgi:anti-anti-sigma factor